MDASLSASSSYSQVGENKSDCSIGLEDGKKGGNTVQFCEKNIAKSSSSGRQNEESKLETAKAEMTQMREENKKLKKMLEQIKSDYQSLHTRFTDVMQRQQSNGKITEDKKEIISLSLGLNNEEFAKTKEANKKHGMDFNMELSESRCFDKSHEYSTESDMAKVEMSERAEETKWPPSKVLKTIVSNANNDEEVALQQPNAKRARVSVRARCDSATMNDGCQWRKYGQKIAKNNPCPRAYYRCTVATGCPVRKQVQRCMDDMSILITTYEGTHNHPLPVSAATMASTTSAAASMMLSGSSTSATSPSIFQGLNFNTNNYPRPSPFYLPNTSPQALSTITLDLTATSSRSFPSSHTNTLPSAWRNGYLDYGTMPYNSRYCPSPYYEKSNQASSQQILTETLTKAITSDPSLRSVINDAISSMVSNSGENKNNIQKSPLQFSL